MTVGVVFMSEIPAKPGKKHDHHRPTNPHNENKKKENSMSVFSIEDASRYL